MHQVIKYCYKHAAFEKGMRSPVEYPVTLDFETGTRSGDCPVCRKEIAEQSVTTTTHSGKEVNWLDVSHCFMNS